MSVYYTLNNVDRKITYDHIITTLIVTIESDLVGFVSKGPPAK